MYKEEKQTNKQQQQQQQQQQNNTIDASLAVQVSTGSSDIGIHHIYVAACIACSWQIMDITIYSPDCHTHLKPCQSLHIISLESNGSYIGPGSSS